MSKTSNILIETIKDLDKAYENFTLGSLSKQYISNAKVRLEILLSIIKEKENDCE